MRFEHLQIDIRDTTVVGVKVVEEELNKLAEKLEKNGYAIVEEVPYPQTDSVKNFFTILYDKPTKNKLAIIGTRYTYKVYDVRDGSNLVAKYLNEEAVRLEGEGKEIIRFKSLPTRNSAFTQALIVHVPTENKMETVIEPAKIVKLTEPTPIALTQNKEEQVAGGEQNEEREKIRATV